MPKPIFNSLGSNYSLGFVFQSLWAMITPGNSRHALELLLAEHFSAQRVVLTYKGRDAIEIALRSYGITGEHQVITQAFTCFAIEEAIRRTGATPKYVDVGAASTNLTLATIKKAVTKQTKAVLVQHSLGQPAEIERIAHWCRQKKVLLIEDLAQSVGADSLEGEPLGSYSDVVILSFGRDKIIDAVSGGAAIFKENPPILATTDGTVPLKLVLRDLIYPLVTFKVRTGYRWGWGKLIYVTAKRTGLLWSPIATDIDQPLQMPSSLSTLVVSQWRHKSDQVSHRRNIALLYFDQLHDFEQIEIPAQRDQIAAGSGQRFPVLLESAEQVTDMIAHLKRHNIHVSDRWYRQAVDCGDTGQKSVYESGLAPRAEKIAERIINLPTHRNIGPNQVVRIVDAIHDFYAHQ